MIFLDGVMGVVVGDAIGSPAQFHDRGDVIITKMIPCEHFGTPKGSWTDDSSLTLATLDSVISRDGIDIDDISDKFGQWFFFGEYTPFGYAYDIGRTCQMAINKYMRYGIAPAGMTGEKSNGNGSIMRILPACLVAKNVKEVETVSSITHAHRRTQIGCGLYYFIIKSILYSDNSRSLFKKVQDGLRKGFLYYKNDPELSHFNRLKNLQAFKQLDDSVIKSTGYIVHTLEAAIWALVNTNSYKDAVLKAVNLGFDADSVGAVCGGLAGLHYGYEAIPEEWKSDIQQREWIEDLCRKADARFCE